MRRVTDKETTARQDAAEAVYEADVEAAKIAKKKAWVEEVKPARDAYRRAFACDVEPIGVIFVPTDGSAQEENAELKTAEAEYLAKLLQSVAEYEASVAESKAIYDAEFDAALDAFVKYGVFE